MTQTDLSTFLSSYSDAPLVPHVIRLLATGEPVALDDIAAAAGTDAGEVARALRAQPGTEWDDTGRVIGFGLTARPTRHHFTVDGRPTLYTWCAGDTLVFPVILGQAATVESTCPTTNVPIHVEITPERIVDLEPTAAVVSQLHDPARLDDIRGNVCAQGYFFASNEAASGWAAQYPDGAIVPVAEAFADGRAACQRLGWTPAP